MEFKITIFPRAQLEITEAFRWYESRQKFLGDEFLHDMDENIKKIKVNPFLFSMITEPYHEFSLNSFPYLLIYRILENEIIIHSVFHTHQNLSKRP